jgi:hypothetical protein
MLTSKIIMATKIASIKNSSKTDFLHAGNYYVEFYVGNANRRPIII